MDYLVAVEGISAALEDLDPKVRQTASMAINAALRKARTMASQQMREEIRFTRGYLTGAEGGRLRIARTAAAQDLEGILRGRDQPTSLARFLRSRKKPWTRGVSVEVSPGVQKFMGRAFIAQLKSENQGLAVRLKPGERVENKRMMVQMYSARTAGRRRPSDANLYLLYGPSVDQVFDTVRADVAPDIAQYLEAEFSRLWELRHAKS